MNDKQILLINPWIYDVAAYDFWIKPVGLLTIGSVLRENGYQISLIDCLDRYHPSLSRLNGKLKPISKRYGTGKFHREPVEKPLALKTIPRQYSRYGLPLSIFINELQKLPPVDAILVSSGMTYWYQGPATAIEILKRTYAGVPIILGGIYATLCYDHAVKFSGADYVIKGPGEKKVLELLNRIFGKQTDLSSLPKNIDELPWPAYDLYQHLASLPILTSRGCPHRCSFCASHLLAQKFEQRDPITVVDEIEFYTTTYGVKNFAFWDDALLVNQKRHLSVILNEVIKRNINARFHTPNGLQPKELDETLAQLMVRCQFKTIRLSYESSDPQRQQMMGKVSDDELIRAIDNLERAGYQRNQIDVYVMMGLPHQSVDEIIKTMLFVHQVGAKIRLASYSPIPGTKDWEVVKAHYNFSDDTDPILTNNSIFPLRTPEMSFDTFEKFKQLARVFNNALDQGKRIFDHHQYILSFFHKTQAREETFPLD